MITRGRGTAAGNIGGLLDALRGQQVSGWLRAKYSQRGYLEEGELYIQTGQPIYARTGNQSGYEALNRLLGWRNIYFSFSSDQPRPQANLFPERARGSMNGPLQNATPFSPLANSQHTDAIPQVSNLPVAEQIVPQKIGPERTMLTLPLTRRQRFIYFLVDGQRTIGYIARCTNKSVLEVELILRELQEQALVTL